MPHPPSRHLAEGRASPSAPSPSTTARSSPRGPGRARTCTGRGCSRRTATQAYADYAGRLIEDPARVGFLVCEKDSGAIAGFININNIVRGGFQCGALSYGAFAHAAGRGLMREGLELVIGYAFGPLGLHRLEINVSPATPPPSPPRPGRRLPPGGLLAEHDLRRRGPGATTNAGP